VKKRAQKGTLAILEKPNAKVRDYDAHVLVCKGGDCKKRGSKTVCGALKNELRAQGMNRDVRIDSVDCLGLCKHGPNLVVYPDGTWYLGVTEEDVPGMVEQHLKDGEPVEYLAAELRPRKRSK
jgi:(2Fe-2S) ferredoxin